MKRIRLILLLLLTIVFFSNCSENCENDNPICSHIPPINEPCAAYFERWFYNAEENSCQQMGYSGCNEWGFESLEACQDCDCD